MPRLTAFAFAVLAAPSVANAETFAADCVFPKFSQIVFDAEEVDATFEEGRSNRRYVFYFSAPVPLFAQGGSVFDTQEGDTLFRRDMTYFAAPNQVVFQYSESGGPSDFFHTLATVYLEDARAGAGVQDGGLTAFGRLPARGARLTRPASLSAIGNDRGTPYVYQRSGACRVRVSRVPEVGEGD